MIEEYPDTWPIDACRALDELKAERDRLREALREITEQGRTGEDAYVMAELAQDELKAIDKERKQTFNEHVKRMHRAEDEAIRLREALWVCVEHNRLHFGERHNTVIQGNKALEERAGREQLRRGLKKILNRKCVYCDCSGIAQQALKETA